MPDTPPEVEVVEPGEGVPGLEELVPWEVEIPAVLVFEPVLVVEVGGVVFVPPVLVEEGE